MENPWKRESHRAEGVPSGMARPFVVRIVRFVGFFLAIAAVPRWLCARDAARAYAGEPDYQEGLARAVDGWMQRGFGESTFGTGYSRFDGEWVFGTYQMAALGFGQVALERPERAARNRARMERAIDRMLSPAGTAFDTAAWGRAAVDALESADGHAAFLGYTNLVLSLHRALFADSKYAALNDAMTTALVRRFEAAPALLIETYPGEIYPVDNTSGIASIALHARALGAPEPPIVLRAIAGLRKNAVDRATGLLFQSAAADGSPRDAPRGSGTALAAYFLSFGDARLSAELHAAVQRGLATRAFGFRALSEYPRGARGGRGDVDSGPLVLGLSVSATGFALAGCRIHRDADCFREILTTADLFGAPVHRDERGTTYVSGGPLGDAILFAMQTAQPRPS
jgi:hypothetical protein